MTNQDTQIILNPELVNQLDKKILYLKQLQLAITTNQSLQVYQLLDSKKFEQLNLKNSDLITENQSALLISDMQQDLAAYLAPELLHFMVTQFDFLTYEAVVDEPENYRIYIGDWWHHRQLGTLNILSVTLTVDDDLVAELVTTAELTEGDTLNQQKIAELTQIVTGLKTFLADDTKRSLELKVIEDQLEEITANKSGLFGRVDKTTREALTKKRDLLVATQKRVPEVQQKLIDQREELLVLEKEDALRHLELQAILKQYADVTNFTAELDHIYVTYMTQLGQK
ncbi:hydrolase [Leuconostoc rapi]|uniref:hydrolase n=1 Tax=Leuconostoc rapi TaxID=1406906 RepID=UPI001959E6F2|nr:hydrolase [Leuconostoc rapi]MBM7434876.1 hypothetical protein [Leuconostoc rapi]